MGENNKITEYIYFWILLDNVKHPTLIIYNLIYFYNSYDWVLIGFKYVYNFDKCSFQKLTFEDIFLSKTKMCKSAGYFF